jgi:predicted transcriptional regulator
MGTMSKEVDPQERLRRFVRDFATQQDAAAALAVSPSYMSDMLAGKRAVPVPVLDQLGLRRAVVTKDAA